jgi:hypothetical protein
VIIAVVFTRLIDRENRGVLLRESVQINLTTERVQSEERNWVLGVQQWVRANLLRKPGTATLRATRTIAILELEVFFLPSPYTCQKGQQQDSCHVYVWSSHQALSAQDCDDSVGV